MSAILTPRLVPVLRLAPLVALLLAVAGAPVVCADEPATGTPLLRFAENETNYGDLLQGELVERELVIHNDGGAVLQIDVAKPSCGCTTVLEFPRSVAPGATGTVRFTIDSKRIKPGDSRKRIRFTTNDPKQPSADFFYAVDVVKLYRSDPANVKVAGLFDQEKSTTVRLIGLTDYGFELIGVRAREDKFEIADFQQLEEGVYEVRIVVGAAPEPGKLRDPLDLLIEVKDGRQIQVGQWVDIENWDPVLVSAVGQMQFTNKETDRLLTDAATPVVKTISLTCRDPERNFTVTGVRLEGFPEGAFRAEVVPVEEGRSYTVRVILPAYRDEAYLRGKIHIETDAEVNPVRTLHLLARFGRR